MMSGYGTCRAITHLVMGEDKMSRNPDSDTESEVGQLFGGTVKRNTEPWWVISIICAWTEIGGSD